MDCGIPSDQVIMTKESGDSTFKQVVSDSGIKLLGICVGDGGTLEAGAGDVAGGAGDATCGHGASAGGGSAGRAPETRARCRSRPRPPRSAADAP